MPGKSELIHDAEATALADFIGTLPTIIDGNPDVVIPVERTFEARLRACPTASPTITISRDAEDKVRIFSTHSRAHCLDLLGDATAFFLTDAH